MAGFFETAMPYVAALLPTIGVAFLFYYVMKYILEGDRRERLAQAQWERAGRGAPTPTGSAPEARTPTGSAPEAPTPAAGADDVRPGDPPE